MAKKVSKKKNIDVITEQMKQVGTYKPEFEIMIATLAQAMEDCDKAETAFKKSGGQMVVDYTNKNGTTNKVKSPEYMLVLELRDSVAKYCRELGITPVGLNRINKKAMTGKAKKSKLEAALADNGD